MKSQKDIINKFTLITDQMYSNKINNKKIKYTKIDKKGNT